MAVNAKFSHTNLAVRGLKSVLDAAGIPAAFAEFTINQPAREILAEIAAYRPDRLLFSCYIWNIGLVRRLGADFRLLFPGVGILLGGPEVSFDPAWQLARMPWADGVLCGEGEALIARVLGEARPKGIYRAEGYVDLDTLPFPYADLDALQNRVLYYESSRGCPFGCAYCLSSADRRPRARSLPLVFSDLRRFLDARVMRVKFVDRTFNLDAGRALDIWRYLIGHDNGVTSFQMELGGDLFTEEQLALLETARQGLFQFEIGVQSTCAEALEAAARSTDFERLKQSVLRVRAAGNIHQHLDLIAGLPLEGFWRFGQSYDEVLALRPEQLQLGFLKLLRGSRLWEQKERYGLVHSDLPPYEVLRTPQISFEELARLKTVEEMTEVYYNSGRFGNLLEYALSLCPSSFEAMLALGESMPRRKVGKYEYYDLLWRFCVERGGDPEICRWLARLDICLHERPRKLPDCCGENPLTASYRRELAALRLPKAAHAEVFPFDPLDPARAPRETALLFEYDARDPWGRAALRKITF